MGGDDRALVIAQIAAQTKSFLSFACKKINCNIAIYLSVLAVALLTVINSLFLLKVNLSADIWNDVLQYYLVFIVLRMDT